MSDQQVVYAKYVQKASRLKKIAAAAGNKEFADLFDVMLRPTSVARFAQFVEDVEEVKQEKQRKFLGDSNYETEGDPFKDRIPWKTLRPETGQALSPIDSRLYNKEWNPEVEFKQALQSNNAKDQDIVLATLFIKYAEKLAHVAVSHFFTLPASLDKWLNHSSIPDFLRSRYLSNPVTLKTTKTNLYKRRSKSYMKPQEVDEEVDAREVVDRVMAVIMDNANGIYKGHIEELKQYMADPNNQSYRYMNQKNKGVDHYMGANSLPVDPSTFEGRFVQGLGTLMFVVAAQQIVEYWGATEYDSESGDLKYRHPNNEIHRTDLLPLDHPGNYDPGVRNVHHYFAGQGKRHDINLQEESEFILKSVFDIAETGAQAFDELYDVRINKADQQYLGQHVIADAKQLSQRITENLNNLFGKFDYNFDAEQGKYTKKVVQSGAAFKTLLAFYMCVRGFTDVGKSGFESEAVETVRVPPQILRYLKIPYDKKQLAHDEVKDAKGNPIFSQRYVPIRPFGGRAAAGSLWKSMKNKVIDGTVISMYNDITNSIMANTDREKQASFMRVLANEIKNSVKQLLLEKVNELIEQRKWFIENGQPYENPKWNAPGEGAAGVEQEQHEWAEFAAIIHLFVNEGIDELSSEAIPVDILQQLKERAALSLSKQITPPSSQISLH